MCERCGCEEMVMEEEQNRTFCGFHLHVHVKLFGRATAVPRPVDLNRRQASLAVRGKRVN